MDTNSPLQTLLLFLLSLVGSGLLTAIRTVIGFFQGQNTDHTLNGESSRIQSLIDRSTEAWGKPGFFESFNLGRFILDSTAVLSGVVYFKTVFPGLGFTTVCVWILSISFLVSHWFFPMLAQAFAPSLGWPALKLHQAFSFFLMGKLGELLLQAHDFALRKLGNDPKLSFLGETNLQKLGPAVDSENPDRSGLKDDEKEMIRSIFDLRDTQAREIMTPRVDVIALEAGAPYQEVIGLITREKFSRIPVYGDSIDNIQGILHVMDLLGFREEEKLAGFKLSHHLKEAYFVPRTKKIGDLMREFRQKHIHMAIVVDEYGGTAGIVTLEDILEEIVGEIHDEDETETMKIKKVEEGVYLVDPIISLSDLNEQLGVNLKPEDHDIQIDTLGGFILFIHGKVPEKGDVIRFRDCSFEILEMEGKKMQKIRLKASASVHRQFAL